MTTRSIAGVDLSLEGAWSDPTLTSEGLSSNEPGAAAELEFEGDFVRWLGPTGPGAGLALVMLRGPDGALVDAPKLVVTHADRPHKERILFARYDLVPGPHRLRIEVPAMQATQGEVGVDRIEWGTALAGTRYIDGRTDSIGDDAADGMTPETPWRTFAGLRGATLAPGCRIRLARGSTWSEMLGPLHGTGRDDAPIVIEPYGDGPRPHIRMAGRPEDRAIWLADPDRTTVRGLEVSGTGAGIVAFYGTNGHRALRFEDIFTHDNDAIHWYDSRAWAPQPDLPGMYHGAAILITGIVPVTDDESAVEDVVFERIRSERDSDPIDIAGFNPRLGNLEFLGTELGSHAVRHIRIRDCEFRDGKGGLNFDNVEDLTIVDTVIAGMCRVPQIIGTTGLFLWSVDRVSIVNCVLSDVPDTGSVDGTGCDLEAYTRRVRFAGTFFARNAAAGIELLAIEVGGRPTRPGDHCVEHEVVACGFSDNVRKHRPDKPSEQLGSIHLRNDTGVPFTGRVERCLYAELHPLLHVKAGGGQISWESVGNIAAIDEMIFSAADAFGDEKVSQEWTYECIDGPARSALQWDQEATVWRLDDLTIGRSSCRVPARAGRWLSRTWLVPRSGRVAIRGIVLEGVARSRQATARITLNDQVLVSSDDRQPVLRHDHREIDMGLDAVGVSAGDRIGFQVGREPLSTEWTVPRRPSPDREPPGPPVSWSPLLAYLAGPS